MGHRPTIDFLKLSNIFMGIHRTTENGIRLWADALLSPFLGFQSLEFKIQNPKPPPGFTLLEIIIALGILTFALVGLLALFPVALETAAESKAETRFTQIAQSVFSDIKASSLTNVILVGGPNPRNDLVKGLDFSIPQEIYLNYEAGGGCLGVITRSDYRQGLRGKGEFLLKLTATPINPDTSPALSSILLYLETPASAPEDRRQKAVFVTMKGDCEF
jgi:type II secretory pathway pseudopilin PulG